MVHTKVTAYTGYVFRKLSLKPKKKKAKYISENQTQFILANFKKVNDLL